MALVTGVIGSIGPKLLELLKDEYKLRKGLRKQVKFLSDELESVHAALRKVAEVPLDHLDEQVKIWACQVREASYEMEDILDTFLVRVEGRQSPDEGRLKHALKKMGGLFSKGKASHDIAGAIEDITKQLKEVAERRARYKVDDIVAKAVETTSIVDPRLEAIFKEVTHLVGIDKSRDNIISMLQVDENVMKTVSIVGIGGLGKTTLAKASYDKLESLYECRAFVSVGRNPDFVRIFKDILFYLDKTKYNDIHNDGRGVNLLIRELQEFLQNKRYLIVIDDVWDITSWKRIKLALSQKNGGSRVIITTRSLEVASEEEVYKLDPLSPGNSRRLFYTRLFGAEDKHPVNHPAEASEKILKKCGGIPLAIITMASMLVGKSIEYWHEVCNSHGFYRGNDDQQVHDTVWILSLSYYDLPSDLKTCLLYLSVYPEDYKIEKKSLIWKWIAEGFIKVKTGTNSLFQQGEEYFNQLINRSLIQPVESRLDETIYGCRVHDMVLDLICKLSVAENFVTISNDDEGTSSSGAKVRRLAHQNRKMEQSQEDNHMDMAQAVRSLTICSSGIQSWVLHPSFRVLRVLDLVSCRVSIDCWQGLKYLGNLLHLRYLGLRNIFTVRSLPEEIGKLKFLQILDLDGSDNIRVLPSGVCRLTWLICLRGTFDTRAPDGLLTRLTSLEELHISIADMDDEPKRQFIKDLGNLLSKVRVVVIFTGSLKGMQVQSDLVQSIGNLHKLQHLELVDRYGLGEAAIGEWDGLVFQRHLRHLFLDAILFRQLPSCISPAHLPWLRHLDLLVDDMDEAGLRALGGFPELRCLWLETRRPSSMACTATVANIAAGDGFFTKLRCLGLYGWMVQLVLNEDSTGVSFSIWNGKGAIDFGRPRTKDQYMIRSVAPPVVMPNLHELSFEVPIWALYNNNGNGSCCDNIGLEFLPSLRRVQVRLDYEGASLEDVDKAEAELTRAAEFHPNNPVLKIEMKDDEEVLA